MLFALILELGSIWKEFNLEGKMQMSELSNRYQQIMKDLQTNIKDEKDKEFVIGKFQELSMMFMDVIDRLTYLTDLRIKEVEEQIENAQFFRNGVKSYIDCLLTEKNRMKK